LIVTFGRGKYALLKLRKLAEFTEQGAFGEAAKPIVDAISTLEKAGILDWGNTEQSEFFVIRLRDMCSQAALFAYAGEAIEQEPQFAKEVAELARRAGRFHPHAKMPD
jgi:hypothetical protein